MKTDLKILPAIAAILTALLGACSSDGCLDNQSAIPLVAAYSSQTKAAVSVRGVAIHGIGARGDSMLLDSGSTLSEIYLPMRAAETSTSWCLEYAAEGINTPDWNDTVTFHYSSMPYFASEECGAMYYYHITQVDFTTHLMDSVVVTDSLITNVDMVRIRFYFPTQTNDED